MQRVRAATLVEPGRLEVREYPRPRGLEPGAVLLRMLASGICGTDKHTFRGETEQYAGTDYARRTPFPIIQGHENVGVVEEVGPGGAQAWDGRPLAPGDRVVPAPNRACGRCRYCLRRFPYYFCRNLENYGNSLSSRDAPHLFGGWSQLMYLLPGTPLFRVPEGLPSEVAVLTEVMAVTHGVDAATALPGPWTFRPGDSVAVIGVGPLGLCHVVKSRFARCGELIAVDVFGQRLERAEAFGVTATIDASQTERAERVELVRRTTGGRGADLVIDCSGAAETFGEALGLVRWGGTVIEAGAFVDLGPVRVNPNRDVCTRNVCVLGIGGEVADAYVPAMEAMAAHLDDLPLTSFVTHRLPLERAEEAIELSQSPEAMKVVFAPNGG
jgi:L-iditol 2-dehydrogenase